MKKTLTLILIAFSSIVYGQTNIALSSINSPSTLRNGEISTTLDISLSATNIGPDTLNIGDTLLVSWGILNGTSGGRITGDAQLLPIMQTWLPGISFDISFPTYSLTPQVPETIPIVFIAGVFIQDMTNPVIDADSTDNVDAVETYWHRQYGASLSGIEIDKNISAFPNPAIDILNIKLDHANQEVTKIELTNLLGKTVLSQTISASFVSSIHQLDVKSLKNGVYTIKVTNGTAISTKKITVQH